MRQELQDLREGRRQLREKVEDQERNFTQRFAALEVRLEAVQADVLKWTFIFWLGNLGGIGAMLFLLVRLLLRWSLQSFGKA